MLTQKPLSYVEGLFPNKFSKPQQHVAQMNGLSVALRPAEFEPPFVMDYTDVKLPMSKLDRVIIEQEENEKAQLKIKAINKENETKDLIHEYFLDKKKKKADDRKAEYEKRVKEQLVQQGVANGMTEEEVRNVVEHRLAHQAVDDAFSETGSHITGATEEVRAEDIRGESFRSGMMMGAMLGLATRPNTAVPTADYVYGDTTGGLQPIRNAGELGEAFGSPLRPSRLALVDGERQRASAGRVAPVSALGYLAETEHSAPSFAPSRVELSPIAQRWMDIARARHHIGAGTLLRDEVSDSKKRQAFDALKRPQSLLAAMREVGAHKEAQLRGTLGKKQRHDLQQLILDVPKGSRGVTGTQIAQGNKAQLQDLIIGMKKKGKGVRIVEGGLAGNSPGQGRKKSYEVYR